MSHIPDTAHMGHRDDNPQRDVPCVDCEREMSRRALDRRGRCADCRTPGGLLVTALRACGVAAERLPKRDGVRVAAMHIDADEVGWHILHNEFADDGRRTRRQVASEMRAQVADVVAAIVQAPALRAELDAIDEALRDACPSFTTPAGSVQRVEVIRDLQEQDEDLPKVYDLLSDAGFRDGPAFSRVIELIAERDALTDQVEQQAESVEILRRSLDLANLVVGAASDALDNAGCPHVPGRTLAERVAALAAERDLADRQPLQPPPDEPPAADPALLALGNRALVAQLRAVEAHAARMAALLNAMADALNGPRLFWDDVAVHLGCPRDSVSDAFRALAGGAA